MELVTVLFFVLRVSYTANIIIVYDGMFQGPDAATCEMYRPNCEARADCDRVCPHGLPAEKRDSVQSSNE